MLNPRRLVDCNPAFERLQASSSLLLLQGPVGPFFDRLAVWLVGLGKQVKRVAFQAGDVQDCLALEPICYKGDLNTWHDFLHGLIERSKIDCLVLFGQSRRYHQIAMEVAQRLQISVVVLEEGYFRPGFITMELGGVNGYSRTLKHYCWRPSSERPEGLQPDSTRWHFQKMAWHATRHYLALYHGAANYPQYQHHRQDNPYRYAAYWLRSWARKILRHHRDIGFQRRLLAGSQPYFLVPLQHDGDAQITHHSPYGENTDFILQVMRSFALHAPQDHWLVFRQHPHSRGGPGHSRLIESLAAELGMASRVHHLIEGDTPDLCQHAAGVVLINSTVGFQALERGAPLMVLGDALYKHPRLTHHDTLDSFWPRPLRPVYAEVIHFLAQIKNLTQMPCNVYANRDEPLRWPVSAAAR